ncbi:hypothetical protein [Burkholderia thailandensis]|uniref:hypothetical protein n=1 Tax=Burkholderia thailandensis TaxID=57975 RepID=UPI003F8E6E34
MTIMAGRTAAGQNVALRVDANGALQIGVVPSGTAGGDLSGEYPNPTVRTVSGRNPVIVLASAAPVTSVTGTTAETSLFSVTVPGNMVTDGGSLRISAYYSYVGTAGIKYPLVRLGGVPVLWLTRPATETYIECSRIITRKGATIVMSNVASYAPSASTNTYPSPRALNWTVDQVLSFNMVLGADTDSATLQYVVVEVLNP